MKLAIITDIHGNRFALDAVLDDIAKQNVDEIIVVGDNVNIHPFSRDCWEAVNALNAPMIQGNHEYYLYTYNTPDADPAWQTVRFQMLGWHHAQFTQGELGKMRALPTTYHVTDTPVPLVPLALITPPFLMRKLLPSFMKKVPPGFTVKSPPSSTQKPST